ncbi:sialin-like [Tubulanus polymorphus]|uniref:sialin-like n=1 Tax=Tubulanus polymorphus TaxID=672921 RepID=UPI003DA41EFA
MSELTNNNKKVPGCEIPKDVPWLGSSRVGLAIIVFFGFFNLYAMRVNISVAIVCMVDQTALRALSFDNGTESVDEGFNCSSDLSFGPKAVYGEGAFVWSKQMQGFVLSSFFWGYVVTQFPGGVIATKCGGKMGVAFPAVNTMWAAWSPPLERSKLTSSSYAGMQIGTVAALGVSGVLCQYLGWPSIFYISGGACLIWCLCWLIYAHDTPEEHPRISAAEKKYIQDSLTGQMAHQKHMKLQVPWCEIAKSPRVWALIIAHFTMTWTYYTFLTNIPSYINDVLKLDIKANGLFSAIMYLMMWIFITLTGIVSDVLRRNKIFSTTAVRKIMFSVGMVLPSALVVALGFIDCTRPILALSLLTAGVATIGCAVSVILCNHVDIAPRYAGILFGITNTFATCSGFLAPAVVGAVTKKQTREEWQIVFYICAAVSSFGALLYLIIGSGDIQSWAIVGEPVGEDIDLDDAKDTEKTSVVTPVEIDVGEIDLQQSPAADRYQEASTDL